MSDRPLDLALFAEGPTDHLFLGVLFHRVAEELCLEHDRAVVMSPKTIELHPPPKFKDSNREERIMESAREGFGTFDLLLIHADGNGDPERSYKERIRPGADLVASTLGQERIKTIPIVPIREMEAWALADGDALRATSRTTLSDQEMGLPGRPKDVEKIDDPKGRLDEVRRRIVGGRRGTRNRTRPPLDLIAEFIRLDRLREVPSFAKCWDYMEAALKELGYLS